MSWQGILITCLVRLALWGVTYSMFYVGLRQMKKGNLWAAAFWFTVTLSWTLGVIWPVISGLPK